VARVLLAFNFLLIYPAGVSLAVAMLAFDSPESKVVAAYALLGMAAFTLPIPSLVARGRRAAEDASAGRSGGRSVWLDGIGPAVHDAVDRRNPYLAHCLALMAATGLLLIVAWLRRSDLANVGAVALGLLAFYLLEKGQA